MFQLLYFVDDITICLYILNIDYCKHGPMIA